MVCTTWTPAIILILGFAIIFSRCSYESLNEIPEVKISVIEEDHEQILIFCFKHAVQILLLKLFNVCQICIMILVVYTLSTLKQRTTLQLKPFNNNSIVKHFFVKVSN